ncbi:disintegrin and metalloproteinase, partial [Lynx pardinus]
MIDHNQYVSEESNTSNVPKTMCLAISYVNQFFKSLDIDVIFIGVEIWAGQKLLLINSIKALLGVFCKWKNGDFRTRLPHDLALIFVKKAYGVDLGLTDVGTIYNMRLNCGVIGFIQEKLYDFAFILSLEIDHSLGMLHDDKTYKCGNQGVVEDGEDCDCGSLNLCAKDPCCQSNCTLSPGATWALGLCCKDYMIMPSGDVCRERENECGLPEWRDGNTNQCPEGSIYVQCNISDILCGSVQCENVTETSLLSDHSSVHWTHPDGVTCWGTDYHTGMTIPHIGAMIDGTECGKEHICIQRKYVHMSYMPRTYTPKTCNMNGVCNNRHHCHCDHEWNPPKDGVEGFG